MSNRPTSVDELAQDARSVRDEASKAAGTLKDEAARLASGVRRKAEERADEGLYAAASSLEDFTAAIRKASEELGERDQSMAAGLVRQAASGLEDASAAIKGKSLGDITHSLAGFARRQPAAFLIGAALAGVALGRFARASGDHADAEHLRRARPQGSSLPDPNGPRMGPSGSGRLDARPASDAGDFEREGGSL